MSTKGAAVGLSCALALGAVPCAFAAEAFLYVSDKAFVEQPSDKAQQDAQAKESAPKAESSTPVEQPSESQPSASGAAAGQADAEPAEATSREQAQRQEAETAQAEAANEPALDATHPAEQPEAGDSAPARESITFDDVAGRSAGNGSSPGEENARAREEAPAGGDDVFASVSDISDGVSPGTVQAIGDVREYGTPIGAKEAYRIIARDADFSGNVQAVLQNDYWLSSGCEFTSLSIALSSMGINEDPRTIAQDYGYYDGSFLTGFRGDPYYGGGVFAQGLTDVANEYLADCATSIAARDLTGTPFESVCALAHAGYPVLVWTTIDCAEPQFTSEHEEGIHWYDNEHCVVLYGADADKVYVSDPLEGLVARDRTEFARIYDIVGKMAVAIR